MWWQREYEEELKRVEDEALRERIRRESQPNRRTYGWIGVFITFSLYLLAIFATLELFRFLRRKLLLPVDKFWSEILVIGFASMFGYWLAQFVYRRHTLKLLRHSLQRHGIPTCIRCGYDLRHPSGERCPECGAANEAADSESQV